MAIRNFLSQHKILSAFFAVLSIFIILIAGTVIYIDRYGLKSLINSRGSDMIGRTLSVDAADIQWSLKPTIHIEGLRLANAEGAKDPEMLNIDRLDVRIAPMWLLAGQLNLPEIRLEKPVLILEKKDEDTKNWDLPAFSKGQAVSEAVVPDSRRDFPMIDNLVITEGRVIYRDAIKKIDLDLALDTATGSGGDSDEGLKLSGSGTIDKKKFKLDATGGSIGSLRYALKDFPLDLKIVMGPTQINFKGTLKDPVKLAGIDALFEIKGDSFSNLYDLTGIPLPPTPPYSLTGRLVKVTDVWSYKDFAGKVGESDLNGSLSYDTSGERGYIQASLTSSLLDANDLGGFIGLAPSGKGGQAATAEQKADARKQAASPRLLPDVKINLARLRSADMDVTLDAKKIRAPGVPIQGLKTRFLLKDGVLTLEPLAIAIANGKIDGKLVFDGSKDIPRVTSDLSVQRLSLKEFFGDTRFESLTKGSFGGKIQLAGNGASLADVLGDSNGRITLLMSGGQISLLIVEASGLDIAEAAPLLLDRDKTTHIRCAVGDFKVTKGILNSEIFVFDTNDTNVNGEAAINLRDETIDARVMAHPKDGSILSARTPITISGRLKKPNIGLSPVALGGKGAAAVVLGTVLTPIAAIIPFIELGLGKDSDCQGLIAQAQGSKKQL